VGSAWILSLHFFKNDLGRNLNIIAVFYILFMELIVEFKLFGNSEVKQ
jgi:hypothetical protein